MEIKWIRTEEEERESIVAQGEEITKLAHKFWNDEPLSKTDKYLIARSLFWLGNDMTTRSSRYLPPKPRGRVSEIPSFDILTEFYSYTLDEKTTKSYAYQILSEDYNVSEDTIRNLVKNDENDPDGVKHFFFINAEVNTIHKKHK